MPLRDLLCVLEAIETEAPTEAAVNQTLALARGYGAHPLVLVAGPRFVQPYTPIDAPVIEGLVQAEDKRTRSRMDAIVADARKAVEGSEPKGAVETCFDYFPGMLAVAKARAACRDLAVLDRPGGALHRSEIVFEEVLFGSGRPVLLAVPDRAPVQKVRRVVSAWDGGRHASRSLAAVLGLFAGVEEVHVLSVTGEKDLSERATGAQAAAHIERHGTKAVVAERGLEGKSVGAVINAYASAVSADLIAMGGFGHSRLREFVLGGVTRELIRSAHTPILLTH